MNVITASDTSKCDRTACDAAMVNCAVTAASSSWLAPFSYWGCKITADASACRGCGAWDQCVGGVRGQYGQCISGISIMPGAYKFDGPAIYYANGKGAYCQYDTVENFLRLNHGDRYRTLPGKSPAILGTDYNGVCR